MRDSLRCFASGRGQCGQPGGRAIRSSGRTVSSSSPQRDRRSSIASVHRRIAASAGRMPDGSCRIESRSFRPRRSAAAPRLSRDRAVSASGAMATTRNDRMIVAEASVEPGADTHRPDGHADDEDNHIADQYPDHPVARRYHVGAGAAALDQAQQQRERDLETGIGDPGAADGDPCGRKDPDEHRGQQPVDGTQMRHDEDDGADADGRADHAADDAQGQLLHRLAGRSERYDVAGDHAGMDVRPVQQLIQQVAEHRRRGGLQRMLDIVGIAERIRLEEARRSGGRRRMRRPTGSASVCHRVGQPGQHGGCPRRQIGRRSAGSLTFTG